MDKSRLHTVGHKQLMLFFFFCTRCAINVTQSSRTTTPSITAVPVERASAMAALPKLHLSKREAGVLPLSESVMSAMNKELHMQVCFLFLACCVIQNLIQKYAQLILKCVP